MQFAQRISLPLLFSVVLLFLLHSPTANGADSYQVCDTTSNFTANSTYQSNLNLLFSSLTTNSTSSTSISGFAKDTIGSVPNRISGLVLCRGDINSSTCSSCLSQAMTDVQNLCPYNKDATIYYDYCLLRYSNHQFLSSTDQGSQADYISDDRNVTRPITCFDDLLTNLMTSIAEYASNNNSVKFGTGMMMKSSNLFPAIYGLVQCTPDFSDSDCMECLTGYIPTLLSGSQGGKLFGWMCSLRYETNYEFNDGASMLKLTPPACEITPAPSLLPSVIHPKLANKKSGTHLALAIPVGVAFIAILALCVCLMKRRRTKLTQLVSNVFKPEEMKNVESLFLDLSLLRVATINFANENKLGEGGFGSVYKGVLPDGSEIAAKRLSKTSNQGLGELKNELVLVVKLRHKNLARLIGICIEEHEQILVYEYMPNKSLDQILFDTEKSKRLDWVKRQNIIIGIARGLLYLHEDSRLRIIHKDLKASNVLLDANMSPKISDFGLARLFRGDQTREVTSGYMAPEYAMRGQFSVKSDVFSYGVLVLEIISGKKNNGNFNEEEPMEDLLSFVWKHWTDGTITQIADPSLGQNYPTSEMLRCIQIGLLCVQDNPANRPTMSNVAAMLSSETVSLKPPSKPAFCIGVNGLRSGLFSSTSNVASLNEVSITDVEPR